MITIKRTITIVLLIAGFVLADNAIANSNNYTDSITVKTAELDRDLFKKMEAGILYSLKSENLGVIESILYNTVEFKVRFPGFHSVEVENALIKKVREGDNHIIRYKAFLTLSYLRNQNQFGSPEELVKFLDVEDPNRIFTLLEDKLKADKLASR
ncbi:MAG: hypothetical protein ACFCU6_00650 [Balneolaceae bacterium]